MSVGSRVLFGHAFGVDFSLPVPVWLFIYAAVAAVLLSFAAVALLYDSTQRVERARRLAVSARPIGSLLKVFSVMSLLLTIASGYFGSQTATENFSVTFFWVIFLVGFTYVTTLFGNVWKFIDPFRAIIEAVEHLGNTSKSTIMTLRPYPKRLSYYPATIAYLILISLELIFDTFATTPANISLLLLGYLGIAGIGSAVFGIRNWFRYADFFSVYFRLIATLSPFVYSTDLRIVTVRKPLSGLLKPASRNGSLLLLVLMMLAATAFDGITQIKQFTLIKDVLPDFATNRGYVYDLIVLVALLFLICGLYIGFIAITKLIVRSKYSLYELCLAFAMSLLPVAVGYHLAHYLAYLVGTGQTIISLVSDPFGRGWNLFGTADYSVNTALLSAHTTWYLQVAAIVSGHVAAVYVAHRVALSVFGTQRKATVSQLPLVGLMMAYTTTSLWIIAQPAYIAQEKIQTERKQERQLLQLLREPSAPLPP